MQLTEFLLIGRIQPPPGDTLQRDRHTRPVHHTKSELASSFACRFQLITLITHGMRNVYDFLYGLRTS